METRYRVVLVAANATDAQVMAHGLTLSHAWHVHDNIRSDSFFNACLDAKEWAEKNRQDLVPGRRRLTNMVGELLMNAGYASSYILILPI